MSNSRIHRTSTPSLRPQQLPAHGGQQGHVRLPHTLRAHIPGVHGPAGGRQLVGEAPVMSMVVLCCADGERWCCDAGACGSDNVSLLNTRARCCLDTYSYCCNSTCNYFICPGCATHWVQDPEVLVGGWHFQQRDDLIRTVPRAGWSLSLTNSY